MTLLDNFRSAKGAEFCHGKHTGCLKGTRGAILDGIELWARDFDQHSIYWLNGLAGTGKSTIAKTIAERLFADGKLVSQFSQFSLIISLSPKRPNTRSNHDMALSYFILSFPYLIFSHFKSHKERRRKQIVLQYQRGLSTQKKRPLPTRSPCQTPPIH